MYDHDLAELSQPVAPRTSAKGARSRRPAKGTGEAKLVLLFFILVVAVYTVIISHRFHLPDLDGGVQRHRKHGRVEMAALRSKFQGHSTLASLDGHLAANDSRAISRRSNVGHRLDKEGSIKTSTSSSAAAAQKEKQRLQQQQQQQQQQKQQQSQEQGQKTRHRGGSHGSEAQSAASSATRNAKRAAAVKAAMLHAWGGYKKYAWGQDELLPLQKSGKNSFAGMAATLLDSLSTLWLMGFKDEFALGRNWVAANLSFTSINGEISLFETNIRVVGGLLSAYDLSGDGLFLQKATQLVDLMVPAMGGPSSSGIPANGIRLGQPSNGYTRSASLAESGSLQLEWTALSARSGNSTYATLSQRVYHKLHEVYPGQGLIPISFNRESGGGGPHFSVGAMADSFYEYLLKLWLFGGQKVDLWRSMWEAAVDDVLDKLIGRTSASNLTFTGISDFGTLETRQEHLACFFPGNMALGVWTGAVSGEKADRYLKVAKEVAHTCNQMYARMPSGLAPEVVSLYNTQHWEGEMVASPAYNILRPETVETFFHLWRITGNEMYQDWCWKIFEAFEKHCRVEAGYVGTEDVTQAKPLHSDTQQSFFLAETLKYLFLVFSPESTLPLDKWVFNTEAHPLRLPEGIKTISDRAGKGSFHRHWEGLGALVGLP